MPQDKDDIKGADAMKQAPTPGPLSGDDELIERGLRTIRTYDAVRLLRDALSATTSRLTGYDWNADPDAITKQQGDAFAAADRVFSDLDAAVASHPDIDLPECGACNGTGKIEEPARTEGANQHSACVRSCDECDGCGFAPDQSLAPTAPVEASGDDCWTNEEIEDLISDAIGDSMDMDWTYRDGAKAVLAALHKEGLLRFDLPPVPAQDDDKLRIDKACVIRDRLRQIWEGDTHLVYSGNPPEPSHDEEGPLALLANEAVEALNSIFPVPDDFAALKSTAAQDGGE